MVSTGRSEERSSSNCAEYFRSLPHISREKVKVPRLCFPLFVPLRYFLLFFRIPSVLGMGLATLSLLFLISVTTANAGTQCKCQKHNAEAEADGTCSLTEDSSYCTITFSATSTAYRRVFVEFLEKVQNEVRRKTDIEFAISGNVDETLGFAFRSPPEVWSEEHLRQFLPVLFAMSQRSIFSEDISRPGLEDSNYRFRQTTFAVTTFIVEYAEAILPNWQNPGTMYDAAVEIPNDAGLTAIASYGCLQLSFDDVDSMVKTRFLWAATTAKTLIRICTIWTKRLAECLKRSWPPFRLSCCSQWCCLLCS